MKYRQSEGALRRSGVASKNRGGSSNLELDFFAPEPTTGLQVRWVEEGQTESVASRRIESYTSTFERRA